MIYGEQHIGGPEENWLRPALDALAYPDLSSDDEQLAGNPALKLTVEEYEAAPAISFDAISNSHLIAELATGQQLEWRGIGRYAGHLVVEETTSEGEPGVAEYMVIGGSLFMHDTNFDRLSVQNTEVLANRALAQKNLTWGTMNETTPCVMAPGIVCKDAYLYYRQAIAASALLLPEMINATLQHAMQGWAMSLEQRPGETTTLFVGTRGLLKAPLKKLVRVAGELNFELF